MDFLCLSSPLESCAVPFSTFPLTGPTGIGQRVQIIFLSYPIILVLASIIRYSQDFAFERPWRRLKFGAFVLHQFYAALISLVNQESGLGFFQCLNPVFALWGALLPGREGGLGQANCQVWSHIVSISATSGLDL